MKTRLIALIATASLAVPVLVLAGPAGPASAASCKGTVASDFNGDGIADAAITEPTQATEHGSFHVMFGTRSGLTAGSPQDQLFTPSNSETSFGSDPEIAAGDFNGDGCTDLAYADPLATVVKVGAGDVTLYQGSPSGLANIDEQLNAVDAGGTLAVDGRFGLGVAVGDLNADGFDDLIVGSDQDIIYVFLGSSVGLTAGTQYVEGAGGVPGGSGGGNEFGFKLATGDFDGDGHDDVAIGAPNENSASGIVVILRGGTTGSPLTTTGAQLFSQNSTGVPGTSESDDVFGDALATGDFKGNGRTDLAIGVPGEGVGTINRAGTVDAIYSAGITGLSGTGAQAFTQDTSGVPGIAEIDDFFGASLASGDFNGNGRDDLAVGAPGETVGDLASAGAVNVLPGSFIGLTGSGSSLWNQNTSGISGTSEAEDEFGSALATIRTRSSARDDLLVGAPGESIGMNDSAGMFHFIAGSSHGLTASGSQAWTDDSSGVKGVTCEACEFGNGFA